MSKLDAVICERDHHLCDFGLNGIVGLSFLSVFVSLLFCLYVIKLLGNNTNSEVVRSYKEFCFWYDRYDMVWYHTINRRVSPQPLLLHEERLLNDSTAHPPHHHHDLTGVRKHLLREIHVPS